MSVRTRSGGVRARVVPVRTEHQSESFYNARRSEGEGKDSRGEEEMSVCVRGEEKIFACVRRVSSCVAGVMQCDREL